MGATAADHISEVISFLNAHADYAVLRNYRGLPDSNASRDVDIIITRDSLRAIKRPLVDLIDSSGWKIITYLDSDRLTTFVCAINTEGGTEVVQWDFFINTSAFGILLMDAPEFLRHKKFNGFLYYVAAECEFLDKYLYNRAVGDQYPEKYGDTRRMAEHTPIVEDKLGRIFGMASAADCDRVGGNKLILRALWQNIKRDPLATLGRITCFCYTYTKNYICSNTGFSIGFTGPDGAGKTTVIDLILGRLGSVFGSAHRYYHFRPQLFGNMGDVAQSVKLKKEVDREYDKPHRGGKTGFISSLVRLLYYSCDYIAGYFVKVKSATRITRIVIFDRYYTDIICDSRRSRIFLNYKFLYWFGRVFIPSLDYNILLTADTATILSRKQELDVNGIKAINEKIDYLATKNGFEKILNNGVPDAAVTHILDIVFAKQHELNISRLIH